jgi:hypothetical protein
MVGDQKQTGSMDIAVGAAFFAAGLLVLAESRGFPSGAAGVPGPAFFPMLVGALMAALGAWLAISGLRTRRIYWERGLRNAAMARVGAAIGLTALYVLAWDHVPFLIRTPIYLVAVYRMLGETWLRSVLLSAAISGAAFVVFDQLFGFRL